MADHRTFFLCADGVAIDELLAAGFSQANRRLIRNRSILKDGRVDYVGVVAGGEDQWLIVLPKTVVDGVTVIPGRLPQPHVDNIANVFGSINRFLAEAESFNSHFSDQEELEAKNLQNLGRLALAMRILEDWRRNGFLEVVSRGFRPSDDPSRVSWSHTLARCDPMWVGSVPVFTEYVASHRQTDNDAAVTQIHFQVVAHAFDLIGWLFPALERPQLIGTGGVSMDSARAISVLQNRLAVEFEDRRIQVLHLLIRFLQEESEATDDAGFIAGTSKFHRVWETICASALRSEYNASYARNFAQPIYRARGGDVLGRARQIPDIIFDAPQLTFVVDAKYYDVRVSLPGWHDLGKQIIYGLTTETLWHKPVANILLFPATKDCEPSTVMLESPLADRIAEPIFCGYLSLMELVAWYASNRGLSPDWREKLRVSVRIATEMSS